jgi:hypothetical protein
MAADHECFVTVLDQLSRSPTKTFFCLSDSLGDQHSMALGVFSGEIRLHRDRRYVILEICLPAVAFRACPPDQVPPPVKCPRGNKSPPDHMLLRPHDTAIAEAAAAVAAGQVIDYRRAICRRFCLSLTHLNVFSGTVRQPLPEGEKAASAAPERQ